MNITYESLKKDYIDSGLSTQKIATKYQCCKTSIINYLKKYNIERRKYKNLYTKNDSFFFKANNLNSYWAGFIAADGCIKMSKNRGPILSIKLHQQDVNLLEEFKSQTKYTGNINYRDYNNSYVDIVIANSYQWTSDLSINFNIIPKKSLVLKPPLISDVDLQLQFIIGLIDGDGSIFFRQYKDNKKYLELSIYGTKEILIWCRDILYNLENDRYKKLSINNIKKHCYSLHYRKNRAYSLLKKLEAVKTPFRLERKWNKIKEYELSPNFYSCSNFGYM